MNDETRDWIRSRPKVVSDLMLVFPPGCKVMAREGQNLIAPAPGIVGTVVSYFENGFLGVVAQSPRTLTSPITGNTLHKSESIQGTCDPEWLEVLEYAEGLAPKDIQEAMTGAD